MPLPHPLLSAKVTTQRNPKATRFFVCLIAIHMEGRDRPAASSLILIRTSSHYVSRIKENKCARICSIRHKGIRTMPVT
jgi:hypothetical protein